MKNINENLKTELKMNYLYPECSDTTYDYQVNLLLNALDNKEVRNIAITGNYGSGKSSLIKTFIAKYRKNVRKINFIKKCIKKIFYQYDFLTVSFMRFQDEDKEHGIDEAYIEKSIINQLLYQVKYKSIPQTRLKVIHKGITEVRLLLYILAILMFIKYTRVFIVNNILNIDYNEFVKIFSFIAFNYIIKIFIFIILIAILILIIYNKIFVNLGFKIKIKDIELEKQNGKYPLNEYKDDIIYILKNAHPLAVIFEDLDRFENETAIFTKLRELNGILNNIPGNKKPIKFIYCVSDDIFNCCFENDKDKDKDKDKENEIINQNNKIKFFDFILPIIPYASKANSAERINDLLNSQNLRADDSDLTYSVINSIAFYLDDMRLIKNIVNEFIIYKQNASKENILIKDKSLFCYIVLKNLFPKDFIDLTHHRGKVFEYIEHNTVPNSNYKVNNISLNEFLNFMFDKLDVIRVYEYYISLFVEGALTHNDINFIHSLRDIDEQVSILEDEKYDKFSKKLDNPRVVVDKLVEKDFTSSMNSNPCILNYDLFDYFFENNDYRYLDLINENFEAYADLDNQSVQIYVHFYKQYYMHTKFKEKLIQYLSKKRGCCFAFIISIEVFEEYAYDNFKIILINFEYQQLIDTRDKINAVISVLSSFEKQVFIDNDVDIKKIIAIVTKIHYRLKDVSAVCNNKNIFDIVISNCLYEINFHNLFLIIKFLDAKLINSENEVTYTIIRKMSNKIVANYLDSMSPNGYIYLYEFIKNLVFTNSYFDSYDSIYFMLTRVPSLRQNEKIELIKHINDSTINFQKLINLENYIGDTFIYKIFLSNNNYICSVEDINYIFKYSNRDDDFDSVLFNFIIKNKNKFINDVNNCTDTNLRKTVLTNIRSISTYKKFSNSIRNIINQYL